MTKRVSFIEIELKKCSLDYGVGACTASIPTTGSEKCFNCRATCQDLPNIDEQPEIVRYSKPSTNIRFDLDVTPNITVPNIDSIAYAPSKIDLGESIGIRSSLQVSFKDHRSPDTDNAGDKYISERSYDPYELGTYWGKFVARHPFIKGQSIWWIQGTDNQALSAMERRHFTIESFTGVDSVGNFSIVAKDILKLTEGRNSQAPVLSKGRLNANITDIETTITLNPTGVGALYPASGKATLGGKEIVSYIRVGDIFTIVRGLANTEAIAHDLDAAFQECKEYLPQTIDVILYDLLVNFSNVPPSYISQSDWSTESDIKLGGRLYSALIGRPESVKDLINELLQQTASSLFWDNEADQLRWQVLDNKTSVDATYDESLIVKNSFGINEQLKKRVSQVWVHYGQKNPLLKLNETSNYVSSVVNVSEESEANYNEEPAYRIIYSRWISDISRDSAVYLSELILQRYATPPRLISFRLMRDSGILPPQLSSSYDIYNWGIQDFTGAKQKINVQAVSVKPMNEFYTVIAEEIRFSQFITPPDPNTINIFIDTNKLNVNLRALYDEVTSLDPSALTTVNVYILSGVKIGSQFDWLASLQTGYFPPGVTINIENNGRILGRGGKGGKGGFAEYRRVSGVSSSLVGLYVNSNGTDGSDAILLNVDVNITNNGIIGGGGGGGAGNESGYITFKNTGDLDENSLTMIINGTGGGGGAGYPAGTGGDNGTRYLWTTSGAHLGTFNTGLASFDGTELLGGGASNSYHSGNYLTEPTYSKTTVSTGIGQGLGGDLGDDALSGRANTRLAPTTNITILSQGGGGIATGGLAGNAIRQNGYTATLIVTGDIRGAIV